MPALHTLINRKGPKSVGAWQDLEYLIQALHFATEKIETE